MNTQVLLNLVLIFRFVYCSSLNNTESSSESKRTTRNTNGEKILSRKRRYLLFPEGSSFQVIFDEIIPIVDYTNWIVLGVTVALAWELPSKAPSEQLEDIREKLNEGTPFLRKDEDVNKLKYVDKPAKTASTDLLHPSVGTNNYQYVINSKPGSTIYYNNPPRTGSNRRKYTMYNYPKVMLGPHYKPVLNNYWPKTGNSWVSWNRYDNNKKPVSQIRYSQPQYRPPNQNTGRTNSSPNERHHYIYPAFGKRSTRSNDYTLEDRFHLEYHRSTRSKLYFKIAKYIEAQGKNGEQCVLRILCEFGKKSKETEPNSFMGEIMRAIFSFPLGYPTIPDLSYSRYEAAHSHEGNCKRRYPDCHLSFLDSSFAN